MTPPKRRHDDETRRELLVDPLDYLLLKELPPEGTKVFDAYPDGKAAEDLTKLVAGGQLDIKIISTRMRVMSRIELVAAVKTVGQSGRTIYQITPIGQRLLQEWESKSSGS